MFSDDVDLNKIFHFNVSYNFDLLKNVLGKIMEKQKESDEKINNLQAQLADQNDIKERLLNCEKKLIILQSKGGEVDSELMKELEEKIKKVQEDASKVTQPQPAQSSPNYNQPTDSEKPSPSPSPAPSKRRGSCELRSLQDTEALTVSIANDDITNKIIKKVNAIESSVKDIIGNVNRMNIPKTFAEHKKYMDAQDIKMDNLSSQIEELKTKIQQIEAALEPMRKQLNEFNIAELFKGGDGLNEGSQAALNMIGAIEKQLKDKIRFLEDRLLKVEQDSIKIKNETTGIKNAQDNINRHLTQNEEALKGVNTNIDEIFNRTGEMEGKVSNFTKALEEHKIEAKGNFDKIYEEIEKLKNSFNDQIKSYLEEHPINASNPEEFKQLLDKEINGVKKSITELERILRNYAKDFGLYELREDVNKLLKDIKNKVNLEDFKELEEAVFDIKDKLIAAMKDDINILKEDNQAGKDDLQEFKRIFANLKATVNELKIAESVGNPMGDVGGRIQQIDTSKFVDQNQFHVFQLQVSNEFKDANSNFENLKNFIDDILDNLKTKTTFKDLKTLEDDITTRLEELKTACIKRFADKQDSSKNFKYLDQQIKHIIEVYIKKQDKSDNWLIAKKPFGHCCASCENYIGDLKENNNYVPWNKYPMRDPNDKLYRIGTGFSKMLQMISLDGNNTQTMNNMPLSPVSNTQPSMPIEENAKTMIGFHPKNELKKVLPTIEGKRMTTTVNQKIEEFNEDTQEIEAVEEFNQPKM